MDPFFILAIKVFECLHQQVNSFFHRCVNMVWSVKGFACPLSILCSLYKYMVLVTFQRAYVTFSVKCVVVKDEDSWRFNVFADVPSFSLFDMLLVTRGLSIWFVHVPLAVYPCWWVFFWPRLESLNLVPFSFPYLGALFYWLLASFHHLQLLWKFEWKKVTLN
jgi:hypothetical protein